MKKRKIFPLQGFQKHRRLDCCPTGMDLQRKPTHMPMILMRPTILRRLRRAVEAGRNYPTRLTGSLSGEDLDEVHGRASHMKKSIPMMTSRPGLDHPQPVRQKQYYPNALNQLFLHQMLDCLALRASWSRGKLHQAVFVAVLTAIIANEPKRVSVNLLVTN